MRKYLIPEEGSFYKANLHTHTVLSDGKCTPEEVKSYYKEHGYSVVAFTDHDLFIPHNDLTDEDFLALNGFELEVGTAETSPVTGAKKTCHMCLVALDPEMQTPVCWHREKYVSEKFSHNRALVKFDPDVPDYTRVYSHEGVSEMMKMGKDAGFFVTYNHPTWSLEDFNDYTGYDNMHAMEIMNNTCIKMGYYEYNERVYDDMLRAGKRIYCIGADDCHGKGGMCGCYIVIKAKSLEYRVITDALLRGDFYASEGPEILSLYIEDGVVTVNTSPVSEIFFGTGIRKAKKAAAKEGELITEATFELPTDPDPYYFRITVTDKEGKNAYTNAYFTDELK